MDSQFMFLAVITVWCAQGILTSSALSFPAKVTSTDGICPSEEEQTETRRVLANEAVEALSIGQAEDNPASSCSVIPSYNPSGYYWITPATGPPPVQVYCDFNRQCGCDGPSTWTRIAFVNISDPNHGCPSGLPLYAEGSFGLSVPACGGGWPGGCVLANYSSYGHPYSRVCGRILGFQWQETRAFHSLVTYNLTVDDNYLDGISITHGIFGSRTHVWSFASATREVNTSSNGCDCSNSDPWPYDTSFVGNDYFCDSGGEENQPPDGEYADDTLWDGAGCGPDSTCCEFNNPPWFCKTLPQHTTDDLNVWACINTTDSDTAISLIELYIQ